MPDDDLRHWLSANTGRREWTAEDWRRCIEAAKHRPGFSPGAQVMHPDDFARGVAAGEIDKDGCRA